MLVAAVLPGLLLALQQPSPGQLAPSPVSRIEVRPAARAIPAGDSIRLSVRALDASGAPVPGAVLNVRLRGGSGEGALDPQTGWLVASSVGKFPLALSATVPGSRPFIDTTSTEFRGVPGPAVRLELAPASATILEGQTLNLAATAYSKANDRTDDSVSWRSSRPRIVSVDATGAITGHAVGRATLTGSVRGASASMEVRVLGAGALGKLALTPSKPSVRQGDVIAFAVDAQDAAGHRIGDLRPTWTFAPGDGQLDGEGRFVAYRPGTYTVTASLGRRAASTTVTVRERDVRRSVTVVGRLPRTSFATSEVWIHPNGQVAYLGTHEGGDRLYAIDISDPGKPVVVDSIMANMRLVNDMQTTADGDIMVFTREGASDRKNGIVIADTRDPLHPKELAQFTDGVAAGVHSVYIYEQPHGRYVFITNDGTGAIDIVNITDPAHPTRAGEWHTDRPDAARYVHDLDIVDGLMYASYWNDGLVILDIGNGKWGGRPDKPVLVSQFKYDLDSLYKEVEDVSRPGFDRGTHTAWRQRGGKYVFIADEVYRNGDIRGAKDASASRMYGTLQVIDVSDLEHPKSVAWYTPEQGGVHNVWQVADTLYLGAYDAGFHVFDISGELKGDLRAQHREIASLNTADLSGNVPNAAFDWGVVVNPKDGLAYVNDFNNGLWIVRVDPKRSKTPLTP